MCICTIHICARKHDQALKYLFTNAAMFCSPIVTACVMRGSVVSDVNLLVCPCTTLVQAEISPKLLKRIEMKCSKILHGYHRKNPTDSGDFSSCTTTRLTFVV